MDEKRYWKFPEKYSEWLESQLNARHHSVENPEKLAKAVLSLSDLYHSKTNLSNLWGDPNNQAAYIAYFFPLNYLRVSAVVKEATSLDFFEGLENIIEFGSGTGAVQSAMTDQNLNFQWNFIESSREAQQIHQSLTGPTHFLPKEPLKSNINTNNTLGVFSYSLNESKFPDWALACEGLFIVEPSTQVDSRSLMNLRQSLMDQGYSAWAPCVHQQSCPLLKHSKKDWCHDRIFVGMPPWFQQLEDLLPMKNRTITMSYLLMRKQAPPDLGQQVRIIGDTQTEKGRVRQMFCRGSEREFQMWLTRKGQPPQLPRGSLQPLDDHAKILKT